MGADPMAYVLWDRYIGTQGAAIGVPHFGASPPSDVLNEKLGLLPPGIWRGLPEIKC